MKASRSNRALGLDGGTWWMVGGSLVGAILAFVYQRVVGAALGPERFAAIGNAWTVMFVTATIFVVPFEQYVTREASRGRDPLRHDRTVILSVGVGTALLGAVIGWAGRHLWFQGSGAFSLILAVMLFGFTVYGLGKGILAGRRHFRDIGIFLVVEGVIRLVSAVALLKVDTDPAVVGWSLALAPLAGFAGLRWLRSPETMVDSSPTPALPFFSAYILGSGAAQMLVASAPLVVGVLGGGEAAGAIVFMTFTLFRAPLTLIFSLQNRLLSGLVRLFDAGELRRLRGAAAAIGLSGVGLVGLAWWVGNLVGADVVALAFGKGFRPTRELAAWAAAGVVAASVAQVLGQLLVAMAATGRLALAWGIGLSIATVTLLVVGGAAEHRVALAFGLGETAAMAAVGHIAIRAYRVRPEPA